MPTATADGVPVDFEVVDAQDIPYADASYDAVTMAYGIRNMPDRPRALAEMFRVLKPGRVARVPGVLHAAQRRVAGAVPLLPASTSSRSGAGSSPATSEGFVYLANSIQRLPRPAGPGRPDARRRVRRRGLEELHRRHRRRPRGKETRGSVAANSSPPLPCSAAAEAAPFRAWRPLPRARAHQVAPAPDGGQHQSARQAYSTRSMR